MIPAAPPTSDQVPQLIVLPVRPFARRRSMRESTARVGRRVARLPRRTEQRGGAAVGDPPVQSFEVLGGLVQPLRSDDLGGPDLVEIVGADVGDQAVGQTTRGVHNAPHCKPAVLGDGHHPLGDTRFGDVTEHDLDLDPSLAELTDDLLGLWRRTGTARDDDSPGTALGQQPGGDQSKPAIAAADQVGAATADDLAWPFVAELNRLQPAV